MGFGSIAKKVVGKVLSVGKKVAKVAAIAGAVAGYGLYSMGKKQIESEHPKHHPPPLPEFKKEKPYDKRVVNRPAVQGIERRVDEEGGAKIILQKDKVALGLAEGPLQDPYEAAEEAAMKAKKMNKKSKKSKVKGLFKKKSKP